MSNLNFATRTLYHADNLPVLRGMNSETMDLIATDPPFNKSKDFHATPDSLAAGARFTDRWRWETDVHPEWVDAIKDDWPGVHAVIEAARVAYGSDMAAFLCWLGVRVIECHRVLKPTGSLYLHIDHTAHAWTKAMMDAIFDKRNFRNEIVWCYTGPSNTVRWFPRKHDTILFYSKSQSATFNRDAVRIEYKQLNIQHQQEGGGIGGNLTPDTVDTYRDKGKVPEDYWLEDRDKMSPVGRRASERTGFPTQKPLALYERIINASSNAGDMVLDPFCGCATTPVAAERLARQWVGIDIWDGAYAMVVQRMEDNRQLLRDPDVQVTYATAPPVRTDGATSTTPELRLRAQSAPLPWHRLSHAEMKTALRYAQRSAGGQVVCAGCGRVLEPEFMELDHIRPKSEGGANHIDNRVLLCSPCNGVKSNNLTVNGLWRANRSRRPSRWMKDDSAAKLALSNAQKVAQIIVNDFDGAEAQGIVNGMKLADLP